MALARYSVTDAYVLEELRREYEASEPKRQVGILSRLQKHSRLPLDIARLAVKDSNAPVRQWFARHGHFWFGGEQEKELVGALLNDPDPFIRACLHENPSALRAIYSGADSILYFKGISHIARLALVRNPGVDTNLVERIFDFQDRDLGIDARARSELALAFLSDEGRLHHLADRANLCHEHGPDYYWDWVDWEKADKLNKFLTTLWEHAAKWPADSESRELSDVAAAVFRQVPVAGEVRARAYSANPDPTLRLSILDGCRGFRGDEDTIRVGLQDADAACRESAYSKLHHIAFSELEGLLQQGDKAALSGLARNRSVPTAALEKIKSWFDEHDPLEQAVSFQISSILEERRQEGNEKESRDEPEIIQRKSARADWLAEILTRLCPGSLRAWFLVFVAAGVLRIPTYAAVLFLIGYWGFARLDRWVAEKTKQKAIDDVMWGWEPDPDDPKSETKGNWSRVRLTGQNQMIVARMAELFREIG